MGIDNHKNCSVLTISEQDRRWKKMAALLSSPPLLSPPSRINLSTLRCGCSSTISQNDAVSSSPAAAKNNRPAVILPGLGNNTDDYKKLALILKDYGVESVTARVSRIDWLRNAAGLLDGNYWRGTLRPRPVLDWYLERVEEAMALAREMAKGSDISLIGHSAGGWLARVYLQEYDVSDVSLLLTLGTPHMAPPKGISGVIDQTRGLLDYVQNNCPKAVYTPKLRYVCIAGRYLQGSRLFGSTINRSLKEETSGEPRSFQARFVGQGYKQVCGEADVWGDGIVPEMAAHLEGALNLSFDGIYHSPVGSDDETRPWYGSPVVVEQWVHHLLT